MNTSSFHWSQPPVCYTAQSYNIISHYKLKEKFDERSTRLNFLGKTVFNPSTVVRPLRNYSSNSSRVTRWAVRRSAPPHTNQSWKLQDERWPNGTGLPFMHALSGLEPCLLPRQNTWCLQDQRTPFLEKLLSVHHTPTLFTAISSIIRIC